LADKYIVSGLVNKNKTEKKMKKVNENKKLSNVRSGGYVSWYSLMLNENDELQPSFKKSFKKLNIIEDLQQDLRGWSAKYCDFSNTDFSCIYASLGNFQGSNFKNADLSGSDFSGANLRGCDFTGADLSLTELRGADLTGANFTNAIMDFAVVGVIKNPHYKTKTLETIANKLQPCDNADLIASALAKAVKRKAKKAKIATKKRKKAA
jgi:uncharacterized protein YjbI with pentapeptide repeats